MSSITFVVFAYVRRGLFEAHKLIVVAQLTMKILLKAGSLSDSEVLFLVNNEKSTNPGTH